MHIPNQRPRTVHSQTGRKINVAREKNAPGLLSSQPAGQESEGQTASKPFSGFGSAPSLAKWSAPL